MEGGKQARVGEVWAFFFSLVLHGFEHYNIALWGRRYLSLEENAERQRKVVYCQIECVPMSMTPIWSIPFTKPGIKHVDSGMATVWSCFLWLSILVCV